MSSVYLTEAQDKKWAPILDNPSFTKIKDSYRREVTGALLENTQQSFLTEAAPLTSISSGGINNWEPVLINLIRRTMPTVVAYDIGSVQPMNGPVGQIYAMRSQYADDASKANWNEALFDAPRTEYSGKGQGGIGLPGTDQQDDMFTASGNNVVSNSTTYNPGTGIDTYDNTAAATGFGTNTAGNTNAENWGGSGGPAFGQMSFTIDRTTVTAKSRALRADYTTELEQDLKQMRGMSVESELTNILSTEIALEINREILYTVIRAAKVGMQSKADYKGIFDADTDSDGRWSVEKWKGLMFHIEREANKIARETRRGKANFIICTSDVASALAMAQILDYAPALQANLEVDDAGNIFAGTLAGRYKVYIDPYWTGTYDYLTLGYKGTSAYDAGIFYCPYIPLEMYRSINPTTFQPSIGFKTRYGLVSNPFTSIASGANIYYRKFKVLNLI
jgi:hypothetical protein